MTIYEIPLSPTPQTFGISLSGTPYRLKVYWADAISGGWIMDIADVNGFVMVGGIPLVTGVDLFQPFAYLGIIGSIVVQTDHDTDAVPTFNNLGITSHLFYVTQ